MEKSSITFFIDELKSLFKDGTFAELYPREEVKAFPFFAVLPINSWQKRYMAGPVLLESFKKQNPETGKMEFTGDHVYQTGVYQTSVMMHVFYQEQNHYHSLTKPVFMPGCH